MNNNTKNKLAVVLLSGGMDSAVCAAIAIASGFEVAALHLNYGQRTQAKEQKCFNDLCAYYDIKHTLTVDVSFLSQIGGSSLTDKKITVSKADLENVEIPSSYVPFRNANLLSIGVSWAEVIGAEGIFFGANQLDNSGYPDCRSSFFEAFQNTINTGTKPETNIKIYTPLIDFTKKDIVEKGIELKVPFELTWSCYSDEDAACGICDSCALRLRGFNHAGFKDPLPYKVRPKY